MTEQQFQSEMRRAETMSRLAVGPYDPDYYAGYMRGLRRQFHGEAFGTEREHMLWLSLADEHDDEQRIARGRGYRDGLFHTAAVPPMRDSAGLTGDLRQ